MYITSFYSLAHHTKLRDDNVVTWMVRLTTGMCHKLHTLHKHIMPLQAIYQLLQGFKFSMFIPNCKMLLDVKTENIKYPRPDATMACNKLIRIA